MGSRGGLVARGYDEDGNHCAIVDVTWPVRARSFSHGVTCPEAGAIMLPDNPMEPGPSESALTLELSLIVLAFGVVILLVIIGKLVWEWRSRKGEDEHTEQK
ncbi:MAG: hypothetical protein ACQEVA_00300 [Myxococcota bacterium]